MNRGLGHFRGGGENFDIRIANVFKISHRVAVLTSRGKNVDGVYKELESVPVHFVSTPFFRYFLSNTKSRLLSPVRFLILELDLLIFELVALCWIIRNTKLSTKIYCGGMIRLGFLLTLLGYNVLQRIAGPISKNVSYLNGNFLINYTNVSVCANGDAFNLSKETFKNLKFLDIGNPQPIFSNEKRSTSLLFVGRLEEIKGAALICDVAHVLAPRKIVVIGDGSYYESIKRQNSMNVRLMGAQSNSVVLEEMKKVAALIMLSKYENWPNVVLEALSVGTPVIAPKVGGLMKMKNIYNGINLFDHIYDLPEIVEKLELSESANDIQRSYQLEYRSWSTAAKELMNSWHDK